jgi:two-component sensor histidine kinase
MTFLFLLQQSDSPQLALESSAQRVPSMALAHRSVARTGVSPSLHGAYQHTLGAEADLAQVESVGRQNLTAAPN